jgi:1-acyl-sn-glycerol-3-phosphate acyltransferase
VALVFSLAISFLGLWLAPLRGPMTLERKARWSQWSSRLVLASLGIHYRIEGEPPTHGLIVCNHLSYLDILIISAATPAFFIAKKEIASWPFFGWISSSNGTIFLDRSSLASANSVAAVMTERMKLQIPVMLFPEGTSTDGSQVLRFHSRLIDPATKAGAPITAAAVRYVIDGGIPERALCWYGDAPFLPHLLKALRTPGFSAQMRFGTPTVYPDRRTAADRTHDEITAMRAQMSESQ